MTKDATRPFYVRISGPGIDWQMNVSDAEDVEVIIKVIERMTRIVMEKPSPPSPEVPK